MQENTFLNTICSTDPLCLKLCWLLRFNIFLVLSCSKFTRIEIRPFE